MSDAGLAAAPLRLAMLSAYFAEHRGGIEIAAGALGRALAARDIEVTWLATKTRRAAKTSPEAAPDGITRHALHASNGAEAWLKIPYPVPFPSAWRAIFKAAARADIVLVHDALYLTSVIAYLAARLRLKPFIVVQHVGLVPYRSVLLRQLMAAANRLIAAPLLKRADKVIFISQTTQLYFKAPRWRDAPALVFNGVDTTTFTPPVDDAAVAQARASLGLPQDRPIAVFVGRFVEKKGLLALQRLAQERQDVVFAFAGWGSLDPAAWALPNVRVFGSLSGASLAPLYRAGDMLLLPSTGEGLPLVMQEALACGLPILCGLDSAGADAQAAAFVRGVAVEPLDPATTARSFSAAITSVLATPNDDAARMRRFAFARDRYSWATAGLRYAAILRSLALCHASP